MEAILWQKLLVPEERRLLSGRDRVLMYKDGVISCRRMKLKGHIQYIGVFRQLLDPRI